MELKNAFVIIDCRSPLAALYRPHCPDQVPDGHLLLRCKSVDTSGMYLLAEVRWPAAKAVQTLLIPHAHVLAVIAASSEAAAIGFGGA